MVHMRSGYKPFDRHSLHLNIRKAVSLRKREFSWRQKKFTAK